jgi:hypothetical protein
MTRKNFLVLDFSNFETITNAIKAAKERNDTLETRFCSSAKDHLFVTVQLLEENSPRNRHYTKVLAEDQQELHKEFGILVSHRVLHDE